MFCTNCGKQIPDGAMFCGNCGSLVAQQAPQQPEQQPQYHTAPYTVPLDASPEAKAQAQQYPCYTVPLDGGNAQQYSQQTVPVAQVQQYPQYTAPVDPASQYVPPAAGQPQSYQHTVPVDRPPVYSEPIPEAPEQKPKVVEASVSSVSSPAVPGKKRVRKLPILLGAIALVLVIVLVAVMGGGNDRRFDEEGFTVAPEELPEVFRQTMETYEMPYYMMEVEDGKEYLMVHEDDWSKCATVEIDVVSYTGKIVRLDISAVYDQQTIEAALYMIETVHGDMKEKDWRSFEEATADMEYGDSRTMDMGGLTVTVAEYDTYRLQIAIPGYETQVKKPAQPRVGEDEFLFTPETFEKEFVQAMEEAGLDISLKLDQTVDSKDGSVTYWYYVNDSKENLGTVMVFTRADTGNADTLVFLLEEYARNMEEMPDFTETVIRYCHGALTEEMLDELYAGAVRTEGTNKYGNAYKEAQITGHGLYVSIVTQDDGVSITAAPQNVLQGQGTSENAALESFPEGSLRYSGDRFHFNNEEFAQLYAHSLQKNGSDVYLDPPTALEGGKFNYPVMYAGEKVGFLIVETDESTGKVKTVSINFYYQEDETAQDHGIGAVLCVIDAGHGAMTDSHWNRISDSEPIAVRDDYELYTYNLDNMKASMTLYADRMFVSIKVGE